MSDTSWAPSVTVAAIAERNGRFLLVEEEVAGRRVYNQPAGHWEPGETLIDACVREMLEESAYRFTPTALVGVYHRHDERERKTYLRFAFSGEAGEVVAGRPLDQGILRALWLTPAELRALAPRHRSPVVMRCVEDYLAGRRYPLELLNHLDHVGR